MSAAAYVCPVGYMPMPASFSHRALFFAGRPRHQKYDDFWCKHPPMNRMHRAKIFAPFDALAGFDACIQAKQVLYERKRILSEGEMEELNETLSQLHSLTCNSHVSRMNHPQATVEYFVPCSDTQNEWYGKGGQYKTVTGTVSSVDPLISRTIVIDEQTIPLSDVLRITLQKTVALMVPSYTR